MRKRFLICALLLSQSALAQQQQQPAVPHAMPGHTMAAPGAPGTGFAANVLLETPLLGTERRIYRLYTIDFAPSGATPRHMHPGDEIALVTEGSVTLELQGEAPRTFNVGQTFHPPPMTPHIARNASATAPARVMVSSITEAGRPSTIMVPLVN